jgi:hypothetical protein
MTLKTIFMLDADVISDMIGMRRDAGWLVVERTPPRPDQYFVSGVRPRPDGSGVGTDPGGPVRLDVAVLRRRAASRNSRNLGILESSRARGPDPREILRRTMNGGADDALVAATVAVKEAVLVTRDRVVTEHATARGVTVWGAEDLAAYLTRSQVPAVRRAPAEDVAAVARRRALRPTGS